MKNYIYIANSQAGVRIYYARANTKYNAVLKICMKNNISIHHLWIIEKDIKELKHYECIYNYDYPDYKG